MHTSLQPLGECHCWWTRVSPRAHVAKFYVRLQLIRSVLRASKFSLLKFIEIVILWIYYIAYLLASASFGTFVTSLFNFLKLLCLAKNHWWGFCSRSAHMVHIVNEIRFKTVYTSWSLFIFQPLHWLGECHCWWTRESLSAHAAMFYGRLHVIRSVSWASIFSVLKFIEIVSWDLFAIPFGFSLFWHFCDSFNFFSYFVWLRITDDGSVLEMRICSILLSLFSYCKSQTFALNTVWGFSNIYDKSTFFVLAGGGSTWIYLQVCTFTL